MNDAADILNVVALTKDLPERGLYKGQVGTLVVSPAPGVFEVEFSDEEGQTYASLALKESQLLVLRHEPVATDCLALPADGVDQHTLRLDNPRGRPRKDRYLRRRTGQMLQSRWKLNRRHRKHWWPR